MHGSAVRQATEYLTTPKAGLWSCGFKFCIGLIKNKTDKLLCGYTAMRLLRYMTKWLCVLIRLQYHCGLKEQGIHMARWLGGYVAKWLWGYAAT